MKHHKYNAQKTVVDGLRFDSKLEARRWQELQLLERAGYIQSLRRQVRYILHVDGVKIGTYIADYEYRENAAVVTEDAKGVQTPLFRWKAKHFAAEYGREIRISR